MQKIVFVFPNYPEVMYSFLLSFAKQEKADIKIVCLKGLLKERKEIYAGDELAKYAQILFYEDGIDFDGFINPIISENQDAVFVFGGFLGAVGRAIEAYRNQSGKNGIIITEKPGFRPVKYCNRVVRFLKNMKAKRTYFSAYQKNETAIQAVLVTGQKGVAQFKAYGMPEEKLYPFMYSHIEEEITPKSLPVQDKIKFVYVGRFNFLERGMDALLDAFTKLKQQNWTLDLVGGYGSDAQKIIAWANRTENVNFIGSWKSNEVISKLQDYDICVSPTRLDGWRIQVNQAIMAGIGTITTGEAISDELVKASNSGLVVNAFKKGALYRAVSNALEHPDVVNTWKKNAKAYQSRISNEKLANYFSQIIAFSVFGEGKEKPQCPWA